MIIYKLTSPSGKSYIGQTKRSIDQRWKEHQSLKQDTALHWALQKYDSSEWIIETIEVCEDHNHLNERECYWINHFNTLTNGYNMTGGGGGHLAVPLTEQHKQRISQARKLFFQSEDGMEWKEVLSAKFKANNPGTTKGKPGTLLGKKHSQQSKDKMSATRKQKWINGDFDREAARATARLMGKANKGRKATPEQRAALSKSQMGHPGYDKQKEATRLMRQKTYEVLFPDQHLETVTNLSQFARENKLDQGNLMTTLKYPGRKHKGYAVIKAIQ